ncbi:hypothetical protein [Galactobacter valiniphilus]|uniref:hypothetical protein n=1 Tax=Galactobacter valiniphilus TaxID=2676122 RepID=UPI003734D1E0
MQFLKRKAAAAAMGCLALLANSAVPAFAEETPQSTGEPQAPTTAQSTPTAGIASTARLTTGSGKPARAGIEVNAFAWPSEAELKQKKNGEKFELKPLATVETTDDGSFDLNKIAAAARVASGKGPVNVTISAVDGSSSYLFDTPLASRQDAGKRTIGLSAGSNVGAAATDSRTITIAPRKLGDADVKRAASLFQGVVESRQASAASWPGGRCTASQEKEFPQTYTQVGATFVHAPGAKGQYKFSQGASTEIGVATSLSGSAGTWSSGGTLSQESSFAVTWTPNTGGVEFYKVASIPAQYFVTCQDSQGFAHFDHRVRSRELTGGSTRVVGSGFSETNFCTNLDAGSTHEIDNSTAISWSSGYEVSKAIGFNLSSRSGFTTNSHQTYTAGKANQRLCGHYGYPNGTPRNVKIIP